MNLTKSCSVLGLLVANSILDWEGLEGGPDIDLNTLGTTETPEQRERRLQQLVEDEPNIEPKYNPLSDAKCFNEAYSVPEMTGAIRKDLYADYAKIFRWGLLNPKESPIFSVSEDNNDVTNNRFPGMCIRMAFHDNTIDPTVSPSSAQEYIAANIKNGWWTGPSVMANSGGDASVLTCPQERLHPNNNYDQSASRVIFSFQSSDSFPKGPGIKDKNDGSTSLMEKYGHSYADALQNCAMAALTFLTEDQTSMSELPSKSEFLESDARNYMSFGRLDACHVTTDPVILTSPSAHNSKVPLCGKADILPGVTLNAVQINNWFVSRGMAVGAWLSLFGTHTTFDNFGNTDTLRNVGVGDRDYFEDYVGCPVHKVKAVVQDTEDPGCDWNKQCASQRGNIKWPMAQSDCATGIGILDDLSRGSGTFSTSAPDQVQMTRLRDQMQTYIQQVGSWVPDCVCGLRHLGGKNNVDYVGPNAVDNSSSNSLFGSVYKQNPHPEIKFSIKTAFPGSMCLEVDGNGNGANVKHALCDSSLAAQEWQEVASIDGVRMRNTMSGKCFEIASASQQNGGNAQVWDCNDLTHQVLNWDDKSRLVFKHSGKCLDIDGGPANALQWDCHDGFNQRFSLQYRPSAAPPPPENPFTVFALETTTPNFCLTVAGGFNGANVGQAPCDSGSASQDWQEVAAVGGLRMRNTMTGKCFEIATANKENGGNLQVWDWNNNSHQVFNWDDKALIFKHSGKCLDIDSGLANALQWSCHGANNQQFRKKFRANTGSTAPPSNPDVSFVVETGSSNMCLTVDGTTDGANLKHALCDNGVAQKFEEVATVGGVRIRAVVSGKCFDVAMGSNSNGANVQVWDCNDLANQVVNWNDKSLIFKHSGKCLDIDGSRANALQWDCHGGNNQKFTKQ